MTDVLTFSKNLIAIPSAKDQPQKLHEVLDLALKQLPGYKFKKFIDDISPSLLIYNFWPKNNRFRVLLNAHLDIVSAKPEQYKAYAKDGKLFGRGAIDMKAAGAAEILAFKEMAGQVKYPMALQLVTDEETGGQHGVGYQIKQGIKSDFYLCGEYSNLDLGCDAKGPLWIKLITHGKRAHGAYVWNGINAVTKLSEEINSVKKLFPVSKNPVWKTTCNFSVLEGGNTVNQVPDRASVTLDVRRISTDSSQKVIQKIKKALVYRDTEMEILEDEPFNHANRKDPLIKLLAKSVEKVTGKKPAFVRFHGASDARYYSAIGTTALDIGPTGEGLHSDIEWVDIGSLTKFHRILIDFLSSIS